MNTRNKLSVIKEPRRNVTPINTNVVPRGVTYLVLLTPSLALLTCLAFGPFVPVILPRTNTPFPQKEKKRTLNQSCEEDEEIMADEKPSQLTLDGNRRNPAHQSSPIIF